MFVIPTIKHGGAELFLLRLCEMSMQSYEICVVVIGEREGLFNDFEALNIKIHYLGFNDVIYFPFALFRLRRVIKIESPNIVQSFLYLADILSSFASFGLKMDMRIWSLRGSALAVGTSYHKLVIQRVAAFLSTRVPDLFVSCSNQVTDFHIQLGYPPHKIITIGNFVSKWALEGRSTSVFLTNAFPEHFKIGLAARYDLGKGHHALVESSLNFLRRNPNTNITLSFSGKGCESGGRLSSDLFQTLENEALFKNRRLKLATVGLLNGINLVNWFQDLDLYFMSSDSLEGFPNSLAEAVTICLPSLANPVGAAKDLVVAGRISRDCTSTSMTELLEQFYREDLATKQQTTFHSMNEILSKYQDVKVWNAYKSVWETSI